MLVKSNISSVFSDLYYKSHNNGLMILNYHNITNAELFKNQIKYIDSKYDIIGLNRGIKLLNIGNDIKNKVIITFDDGYKGTYNIVRNITKNSIPISIFLSSKYVIERKLFWWDKVRAIAENYNLDKTQLVKKFKNIDQIKRDRMLKKFYDSYNIEKKIIYNKKIHPLNKEQIKLMAKKYNVEFGAHSHNHYILTNTDTELIYKDLKKNKDWIESITNRKCRFIAYPNNDYNSRIIKILKNLEFEAALADYNINNARTDPYKLGRIGINENDSIFVIEMKMTGVWYLLKGLLKSLL